MSRVKGWCPSAHAPMVSGDGLLMRVKPRLGRLTSDEVTTLCDLAARCGSGLIDITSRANLQLRGVTETNHPALLADLIAADLVDADAQREAARTIVATPFWIDGDRTTRLFHIVSETLARYDLPGKFGVAIDTGPAPLLHGTSGDFRFEVTDKLEILLRAEGSAKGRVISEAEADAALSEMLQWFLDTGGAEAGRVARHLKTVPLPAAWQQELPGQFAGRPGLGGVIGGRMVGVPFGSTDAGTLATLMQKTGARALRLTPWRMLFLENAQHAEVPDILTNWSPVLDAAACPGAPLCEQATVATRELARDLAATVKGSLHISGCAKGCARPKAAALTLVGRDGRFDLVRQGRAGDTPVQMGLTADEARRLEG